MLTILTPNLTAPARFNSRGLELRKANENPTTYLVVNVDPFGPLDSFGEVVGVVWERSLGGYAAHTSGGPLAQNGDIGSMFQAVASELGR